MVVVGEGVNVQLQSTAAGFPFHESTQGNMLHDYALPKHLSLGRGQLQLLVREKPAYILDTS